MMNLNVSTQKDVLTDWHTEAPFYVARGGTFTVAAYARGRQRFLLRRTILGRERPDFSLPIGPVLEEGDQSSRVRTTIRLRQASTRNTVRGLDRPRHG